MEVAAHVAGRDAGRAAAGDQHVGLILTHAHAEIQRLGRAVGHVGDAGLVSDGARMPTTRSISAAGLAGWRPRWRSASSRTAVLGRVSDVGAR